MILETMSTLALVKECEYNLVGVIGGEIVAQEKFKVHFRREV